MSLRPRTLLAWLGLLVSLAGCPTPFGMGSTPTSLSATRGEGQSIQLSWSGPTVSEDAKVTGYSVYRNGSFVGHASGTSWSDTNITYGVRYSYYVTATISKAGVQSVTGPSPTATGWCLWGPKLQWGTESNHRSTSTTTGWFKVYWVKGWTFHLVHPTATALMSSVEAGNPDSAFVSGTGTLVWNADRMGTAWLKAEGPSVTVTAWYE